MVSFLSFNGEFIEQNSEPAYAPFKTYAPSNTNELSINDKLTDLWTSFSELQRGFQLKLMKRMKQLKESISFSIVLLIMLISVGYGIIHALGPGHGKLLISSYYLNRESKILSAVKIGAIVAFTHSGLALIIGLLFGLLRVIIVQKCEIS